MHSNRPDLNLLVVLDAVARTGSASRAAEALSLSQPAVSHALNRLRAQTGDALFVRNGRRLDPTPRAREIAAEAGSLIESAGRLLARHAFDAATTRRRFRIAASDYSSLTLAPGLIGLFAARAPMATLDVESAGPATLHALAAGALDASFWGEAAPAGMRSQILFHESLTGVARRGHPALRGRRGAAASLDAYLACAHVTVSLRSPGANPVDTALAALGRARRTPIVVQSFAAAAAAIAGGDLVAALPRRLTPFLRGLGLVLFDLPFETPEFPYRLIWSERAERDPGGLWLRALIREANGAPA
jgi:DNA-binding transcriptional LysR family regulator